MALADTAKLVVDLSLAGNFSTRLGKVSRDLNTFDTRLSKTESRAFRAGQQIGTGIRRGLALAAGGFAFLALNVQQGLDSLIDLEKQQAQTNAVIKSTGGIAGITATKVRDLAEKYEGLNATIGDEVIQSGENLLLTFTQINKKAFEPALAAALDLSTALGVDLNTAIRTVGKALSEPDKAMARLRRQGIVLTKSEEKQIKAHLKNNDTLGAQDVILKALNKRYGGSFLAGGTTTAGKVAKFRDAIEDLQRTLAVGLLPVVSNVADSLSKLLSDPQVQADVARFGQDLAKVFSKENVAKGAQIIGDVVGAVKAAIPTIKEGLGTAATVIGGVLDAFSKLPKDVQQLAVGALVANKLTGGLVTNLATGLAGAVAGVLKNLISGVVNVQGGVVNVTGPGGPGGGPTPVTGPGKGPGILDFVKTLIPLIAIASAIGPDQPRGGQEKANADYIAQLKIMVAQGRRNEIVNSRTGQTVAQALTELGVAVDAVESPTGPSHDDLTAIKEKTDLTTAAVKDSKNSTVLAVDNTRIAVDKVPPTIQAGSANVVAGLQIATANIVAAVYAARPIVNVTNVQKTTVIQQRYGNGNGSYGTPAHDLG